MSVGRAAMTRVCGKPVGSIGYGMMGKMTLEHLIENVTEISSQA
jgi:hypothetical protein